MTTQELKNKIEKVLGNSIRCLLPSYWWKNLFHSVADRIDEVETTVTENVSDMVVKSLKEFEAKHPDIERSTLYYTTDLSSSHALRNATILRLWVTKITANPEAINKPLYIAVPFSGESYYVIQHATYRLNAKQGIDIEFLNIPFPDGKNYNVLFSIGNGGAEREPASSSDGGSVMFVADPLGNLTEEQKQNNADAYLKVIEAEGAIDINIMVMFFIAKPNMVSVNDNGDLVLVAAGIDGGASRFIFTPEGDVTVETVEPTSSGGVEIRELRISGSDEDNAYNLQTVELYKESKAIVVIPVAYKSSNPERTDRMQMPYYVDLYTNTEGVVAKFTFMVEDFRGGKYLVNYTIKDDGSIEGSSSYTFDSAMSDESVNAVQNKVIKKYIDDAIANVGGGGGSNIVVDTEISSTSTNPVQNKVVYSELQKKQGTINDLADIRSGAALGKTALQSVPSEYVTESELTEKGYATTSQVNDKQDAIDDLEAIRSGAAKGETAIQKVKTINGESIEGEGNITIEGGISQENADKRYIRKVVDNFDSDLTFAVADGIVGTDDEYYFLPEKAPSTALDSQILATKADIPEIDTSALVTKEELAEAEEVAAAALNDLEDRKADKEYVEDALKNIDTSSLASKEELEALRNEVITNEEIVASSLNDLEERKADKEYVEDEVKNLEQFVEDALGNVSVDTSTLVTKEEFADVEEVWAASYNLLNQKISDVQQYIYDEAASRRQFDEAIAEIQSIIAENESVVTAAWNQLNTRINALEAAQAQGE